MTINQRIDALRTIMKQKKIDVCILPSADSHQSEYVADHWRSRAWISGFTGSAGTAVITQNAAGLWTDGRYFIQAEAQISDSYFTLFRMAEPNVPTVNQWIKDNLHQGSTISFDGSLFSQAAFKTMKKTWETKQFSYHTHEDLIDLIWTGRPAAPTAPLMILPPKFAGLSHIQKRELVWGEMQANAAKHLLLCSLDDIAWLFNIRGKDMRYSPVVIAFAIISMDASHLYVDAKKLTPETRASLQNEGVMVHGYEEISTAVSAINHSVMLDPSRTNVTLYAAIGKGVKKVERQNPTTAFKAQKSPQEIHNLRRAILRDSAALTKFIYWVKRAVLSDEITEIDATENLNHRREAEENYFDLSFGPIAAYGANAAMMHYSATPEQNTTLRPEGFFLVDSGGNYLDGTADITRTIVLGPLTKIQKRHFTLTLKGVIALSSARFLTGITGANLDILSRQFLWKEGINYKCGTGHGVGYFLNVHEGPQNFSPRLVNEALKPGMVTTVEPGVYLQDRYGIRTENMVLCVENGTTESGSWLAFETLNFVPIDVEGIDTTLLTAEELVWINNYHQEVFKRLHPKMNEEEAAWLQKVTTPLK